MKKVFRKRLAIAVVVFVCVIGYAWLSYGVFFEREFGDPQVFKKHRLCTRFFFISPVGERDTDGLVLTPSQQQAERDYDEFVPLWQAQHFQEVHEQP